MISEMLPLDLTAGCVRWICERLEFRNLTSEEEVERLAIRYLLREDPRFNSVHEFVSSVRKAIFEEPISLSCFFPDRVERGEGTLYARHAGKRVDGVAVKEMLEARRVLDSQEIVKSVLSEFFGVEGVEDGVLLRFDRKNCRYTVFVSTVRELFEDIDFHMTLAGEERHVVVLLTEKTPLPFIAFFRQYSETVRRAGVLIWVVDVERESVDPFIGYPPEKELIGRFRNPKLATKIESLWRVNVKDF